MSYIDNAHPALRELAPNGQQKVDFLAYFNDGFVITDQHLLANVTANNGDKVKVDLLPEAKVQPKIVPRGLILHTQGGSKKATNEQARGFFLTKSQNESHIVGPEMVGGKILQIMPFNVKADSNSAGNFWAYGGKYWGHISIETQDSGGANVPLSKDPWSLEQLNFLAAIATALCATYGMSCGDMPTWQSSGIVAHNRWPQFSAAMHNCPGPARTLQLDWIRQEVANRLALYFQHAGGACPGT